MQSMYAFKDGNSALLLLLLAGASVPCVRAGRKLSQLRQS
jgi:hypothetical protein